MNEFTFYFSKNCSCQTKDTIKLVKDGNQIKLYVNNFLLYTNVNDIKNFLNSNRKFISEQDFTSAMIFLSVNGG